MPADDLERLQADYYQQWTQLGQQLLTQQPFSFNDWRFTSANWSNPFFGSLASSYLHNASFLLQLLEMLKIEEDKPRQRLRYLVEQAFAASAHSNFLAVTLMSLSIWWRLRGAACSLASSIWPTT